MRVLWHDSLRRATLAPRDLAQYIATLVAALVGYRERLASVHSSAHLRSWLAPSWMPSARNGPLLSHRWSRQVLRHSGDEQRAELASPLWDLLVASSCYRLSARRAAVRTT